MDPSEYQDYMQKQGQYHMDAINRLIEETIVELERLRATVVSLQGENAHLRAMNRRVIEALAEQMPIQGIDHGGKYFSEYQDYMQKQAELQKENCPEEVREMKKGKRLTSAYDEYEARERLRKTRLQLNAAQGLAAALMEPKPWVGLTDEEIVYLSKTVGNGIINDGHFARAIEAKLKEKNGG